MEILCCVQEGKVLIWDFSLLHKQSGLSGFLVLAEQNNLMRGRIEKDHLMGSF